MAGFYSAVDTRRRDRRPRLGERQGAEFGEEHTEEAADIFVR